MRAHERPIIPKNKKPLRTGSWWELYDNGLLVVHCKGEMQIELTQVALSDYTSEFNGPGTYFGRETFIEIDKIIVCDGVTSLHKWLTYDGKVKSIEIPASVQKIDCTLIGATIYTQKGSYASQKYKIQNDYVTIIELENGEQ